MKVKILFFYLLISFFFSCESEKVNNEVDELINVRTNLISDTLLGNFNVDINGNAFNAYDIGILHNQDMQHVIDHCLQYETITDCPDYLYFISERFTQLQVTNGEVQEAALDELFQLIESGGGKDMEDLKSYSLSVMANLENDSILGSTLVNNLKNVINQLGVLDMNVLDTGYANFLSLHMSNRERAIGAAIYSIAYDSFLYHRNVVTSGDDTTQGLIIVADFVGSLVGLYWWAAEEIINETYSDDTDEALYATASGGAKASIGAGIRKFW